jgi:biotin carboxyl carrier protein
MNFDVAVNGRGWKVAIEPAEQPGDVAVLVKGRARQMNASWIDEGTLSLIEQSSAREIRFQRRPDGALLIGFDGKQFEAVVHDARLKPRPSDLPNGVSVVDASPAGRDSSHSPVGRDSSHSPVGRDSSQSPVGRDFSHAVRTPMPGRVVRVLVAVGDRVAAGQGVVIVEAMKMENELRSASAGVVKEVNVGQGAAVEAGTVLVVIE